VITIAMTPAMMVIKTDRVLAYTPPTPARTPLTRVRSVPAPGRRRGGGPEGATGTGTALPTGVIPSNPAGTRACPLYRLQSATGAVRDGCITGAPADDTWFGSVPARADIEEDQAGYCICHPEGIEALRTARQVTIVDPEWCRNGVLWPPWSLSQRSRSSGGGNPARRRRSATSVQVGMAMPCSEPAKH
jgi:hypothetical protein